MKVCIVGGGHIGTTLASFIKYNNQNMYVSIYTRRPEKFSRIIKCNDWEGGFSFEQSIDCISNNPAEAAQNADLVFVALPHFAVEKAFCDIAKHVSDKACIGVIPGGGGCEFFFGKYFKESQTLFGFQRVPFTAKLEEYGHETNLKSWKPYSVVGTQKRNRIDMVCEKINMCGLKTQKADNYLAIALTPTNPILHTSRIFDIFGKYHKDYVFDERCKFYVGWTDDASEIMLLMDKELHYLLDQIHDIDTSAVRPLTEHYESLTIQDMTRKINNIPTFQSVYAPMKKVENGDGYVADIESRMFTEDFPWGLAVIRSYFTIYDIKPQNIDKVLKWYANYMGLDWYVGETFCGKDLAKTGVIQKYGISTKEEIIDYYINK